MQNLKVWQKLGLLGIVFAIPLLMVTWQMISSQRELGINFAQKEIYGTEYNTPVMPLIGLLQAHVGDTSNLVFDPDQDSYYLMDATVFVLPELTEVLGQARGMGAGIATRGVLTSAERDTLNKRLTLAEYYQARLDTAFEKAFAFNPALKGQLEEESTRLTSLLSGFRTALREDFLDVSTRGVANPSLAGPDTQAAPSRRGSSIGVDAADWWDVQQKTSTRPLACMPT